VEFTVGRATGKQDTGRTSRDRGNFALKRNFGNTTCYPVERSINFGMKRILLALLLPGTMLVMSFSAAQTPDANQEQKLLALIKDVQTQQTQLAENQAKIEEKLADVTETIRTARIYTKREK
jgi:uncharacterized protein YlxW (UPF0749 family)